MSDPRDQPQPFPAVAGTLLLDLGVDERRKPRAPRSERRLVQSARFPELTEEVRVQAATQATQWAGSWARKLGLTADIINDVEICLEEAIGNILIHGGPQGQLTRIRLDASRDDNGVTFQIEDDGPAFNPLDAAPPSLTATSIEDVPVGGLGIHFIRECADVVAYDYTDGRNRLMLRFHIPAIETALQTAMAGSALLAKFPYEAMWQLAAAAEEMAFEPGSVLMRQGETGGSALALLEGEVDISIEISGQNLVIARVGPGNMVGEMSAFSVERRTATATAVTRVVALRIDHIVLQRLIGEFPDAARAVIAELADRIGRLNVPLAFLTHAANALEQGNSDEALLNLLMSADFELPIFTKVIHSLSNQIRAEQRRRADLAAAGRIQEAILPRAAPTRDDGSSVDLATIMTPAASIGGDFFDHFLLDDGRLLIAIADVSGKGIPAALFMAMTCTMIRSITKAKPENGIAENIAEINRMIERDNDEVMFLTGFFAVIDLESGRMDYCNAGHNPPFLRRVDGTIEMLTCTGPLIGVIDSAQYEPGSVTLQRGDLLVTYTDGVTEAMNNADEEFGDEALRDLVLASGERSPQAVIEATTDAIARFAGAREPFDDVTMLVFRA